MFSKSGNMIDGVPIANEAYGYFKSTIPTSVFDHETGKFIGSDDDHDELEEKRQELYLVLWNACSKGDTSQAKQVFKQLGPEAELVINTAPNGCNTLLFKACEDGQKEIVKLLLENGADGRCHPVTRYSPLYIACYYGRKDIVEILLKKFPELVQQATVEKWLPIHAAAINGHINVMNLLLEFSYPPELLQSYTDPTGNLEYAMPFDINAKDVTGQSVLYIACYVGNHRMVELLLKFRVKARRVSKASSPAESDKVISEPHTGGGETSSVVRTSPKRKLSESLQNIMSKLNLRSGNGDKDAARNEVVTCPVEVDLYSNNDSETALHVAVKNKHYNIASLLLQNGASPNLKIAATEHDIDRSRDEDFSYSGSTALVEACRNRDATVIDLLIRYGARDDDCKALRIAASNKDYHFMSKLLSLKAHQDPEYKINKKSLDVAASGQMTGLGSSVTYSALFPTSPVMINWHRQRCLQFLREQWLIDASVAHNVKLKLTPKNQRISMTAITRLDISSNELTELLPCIFQMPSLKILNAAQNKLERLPDLETIKSCARSPSSPTRTFSSAKSPTTNAPNNCPWFCPILEEIHLQENRLETIPPFIFELPSLVILDLSNNKLQSLHVKMWSAPKLREINVSLNMLHDLPSMPHHQIALPQPFDGARNLSKDSAEDLQSSVESSPVHSVDVLTVTNCENKSQDGRYSVEGFAQTHLVRQDIHHHNVWSRSVEIVDALPDGNWDKNLQCQLISLNLAHNAYERVPPVLACCALGLARLNLSYNQLTSMGPVSHYPANLKHLDLSHNRINSWFSVNQESSSDLSNLGVGCYNVMDFTSTKIVRKATSGLRALPRSLTAPGPLNICPHRRHVRLDNLRTLILADNDLDKLILSLDVDDDEDDRSHDSYDTGKDSPVCANRYRSLFTNLSMLDISNNCIREIPTVLSELTNLSVLNLSGNLHLTTLPPEMGLLNKLWNLNTRGCNLNDPLKSMIESKKYKTMDIIGYLKSILEDAKPYARMKLMIVGIQGIGKTSLLEQLRMEGTGSYKKKPPEHWAKRMGNRNINLKTAKGISMSTVGVDVGDWTFEKKIRGQSTHGPVTFRTWDFGGQREYYATHQYFLSKRSLYLVVWRITDGEKGVNAIQQWLVNIQARAPNAPVLIVGTHYDLVKDKFPPSYSEELQQLIRERFINIVDADKCGLPRVLDTIEISCKTRHNIKLLCSLMYDCVFGLSCPGSKERLLEQKIPATYLALEDVVGYLALERRLQAKDPVLRAEQYKMLVMHEMQQKFNIAFRDMAELNQATTFLHENGVLLHYEDATLKDLYFLDPQWLCDMLAHVVTIREINPFARNGIMKIEDLKHVFKTSQCAPGDAQMYILNLLNKFEVALTWDNRTLLIPSLLPTEEHLRAGLPGCDVRIPVRSRSWALRKTYASTKQISAPATSNVSLNLTERKMVPETSMDRISAPIINDPLDKDSGDSSTFTIPPYSISHQSTLDKSIFRLLLISYFPSGFWSRLMTRILADDSIVEIIRSFFSFPRDVLLDPILASALNRKAEWICWQTGMELRYLDTTLFRLKEVQANLGSAPCDYNHMKLLLLQEGNWSDVDIANSSILEILLPNQEVMVQKTGLDAANKKNSSLVVLKPNQACVAKLLALSVDHIDILLEDWYPTLGTRFVHTSEGKFLVTRVVPCMDCLVTHCKSEYSNYPTSSDGSDDMWQLVDVLRGLKGDICYSKELYVNNSAVPRTLDPSRLPRNGASSPSLPGRRQQGSRGSTASHDSDSGVGPDSNGSSRKPSAEGRSDDLMSPNDQDATNSQGSVGCEESIVYSFMVEECILTAYEQRILKCPVHGEQQLTHISPDTIFGDLGERYLIPPDNIKKGKMLGRGAFGFVFKATVKQRGFNTLIEVAMKMLQPVEPGYGARQSDTVAYKAAWNKWQRDPLQYACKAYCTARQELNILLTLRHPNIVPLVGICTRPLALVLRLAPQGALDAVLRNYRRSGARLDVFVLQKVVVQVSKALEYLHQQHIIYRDLKSENVLVWDLPPPFHSTNPQPNVDVKLADYGISRATLPTGTKGFGGTEGFMAPEIMRFNGEEEYTEKVDCFSFGMFMYELVTLHLPFEGQECVKDNILEGGRPSVTNREMIYPTYILDLMTLCWAQQPKDRPSASQIVSIGTAPEFVHLVDVVSLQEHATVLSATATVLDCEDDDYASQTWEVWLSRLGKQIDILSCGQHSWHEYKVLNVDAAAVTALCVVEETVWLGDSRGTVHVYSSLPYVEVRAFSLDVECSPPLAIRNICYLKSSKKIAVTTNNGRLWLCDLSLCKPKDEIEDLDPVNNNQVEDDPENPLVRELGGNGNPIFCVTAVSLKDSCQLWCGQTQGSMSVYKFQGDIVVTQEVVYHYDPIVDNVDVTQLISGNTDGPAVWSYIYPGCVVYLWDVNAQEILQKLDCSKLVPCSESLMSISIEEHLSPGRCQVTAMAVQGSELYIGTTWGCIVVAEGSTMRPITIFRPYEEEVKVILPLARSIHRQLSPHQKDCDFVEETTFPLIATAGKGYRNLIGRYTVLPNSDESPLRSMFLMLWQTEFWFSN